MTDRAIEALRELVACEDDPVRDYRWSARLDAAWAEARRVVAEGTVCPKCGNPRPAPDVCPTCAPDEGRVCEGCGGTGAFEAYGGGLYPCPGCQPRGAK
jgi:hypothetical protein